MNIEWRLDFGIQFPVSDFVNVIYSYDMVRCHLNVRLQLGCVEFSN